MLELPELEQRLSNLQSEVERLWRKAEASVPPVEQRLATMADQYAEYLKRWAATVERHTQAVAQLEAYASEWKDASARVRQEAADRLQGLESTIEREWDTLRRLQEEPLRELREQAESLSQVSLAMATASQRSVDRAEARFASFEHEVHLRLEELTRELQAAVSEMKTRLDRHPAARLDTAAQWSFDEVTRLHGQLRDGARPEFPRTIDHPPASGRELPAPASADLHDRPRPGRAAAEPHRAAVTRRESAIPARWAAAVVVLAIAVVIAAVFGWRMQGQIQEASARARVAEASAEQAVGDAARQTEAARQAAEQQIATMREMTLRAQRIADVMAAPDLIRWNLSGGNGASGQALFSRSRGFVVSGSGLPPPPSNGAHQVWLLTRLAPVKAGTLATDPDGTVTLVQQTPLVPRAVVGVMVTTEPSDAVEAPTGPPVLTSVRAAAAAAAQP